MARGLIGGYSEVRLFTSHSAERCDKLSSHLHSAIIAGKRGGFVALGIAKEVEVEVEAVVHAT